MRIRVSKEYILFLLLFYTFLFNEQLTTIIPVFKYEDELIAVAAIPLFVLQLLTRAKDHGKTGAAPYVVGFVLCALAGSLLYHYQSFWTAALPDLLLCVKFWLGMYVARKLFQNFDIYRFSHQILFHVKLVTWIYFLLSAINMIYEIFPYFGYRYGLGANSLFYVHPMTLAACCAFLLSILMALKQHTKHCFFYVGLLVFVLCTTLRVKALASAVVFLAVYFMASARKKKFSVKSLLAIIPVLLLVGWSQLEYYYIELGDESARSQLLVNAFAVANDHFPFGAGFATYGSHYSAISYSPLYYEYQLNTIFGLQEGGEFICDSFWPMLIGQSGYIGAVFYILALVSLIKKITKMKQVNVNLFAAALAIVSYLLVESFASTAFVHPIAMPMAIWLGILMARSTSKPLDKAGR